MDIAKTTMRTAGIWVEDGCVLLESLADREVWGIPGGGLEPDESAAAGCLREYAEELGLAMQIEGVALVSENFWRDGGTRVREYCFYFLVRPKDESLRAPVDIASKEDHLQFRWFRWDQLRGLEFVPPFLRDLLPQLSAQTRFLSTADTGQGQ